MKIDKKLKKTIDKLVVHSFDISGQVVEKKVKEFSKTLVSLPNSSAISALTYYLAGLKRGLKISTLEIESAINLSEGEVKKITDLVKTKYAVFQTNVNLNQQLLGGLRIKIGDFVFDDSIKSKINQLKGVISE